MRAVHTALDRLWPLVVSTARGLDDTEWAMPSPLEGWTVGDIVAHLAHGEGTSHGFPQPEPAPGWSFDTPGLHESTNRGVAARRALGRREVVDELAGAADATLAAMRSWDDEAWQATREGLTGPMPAERAMEMRLADVYVHLLDIVVGLDRPVSGYRVPEAEEALVERAVHLVGWAAVKQAHLLDGTRVRLEIAGPGGTTADLVVSEGRGRLVDVSGHADGRIAGPGIAFALRAGGRRHPAELITDLLVEGPPAAELIDHFGLFG